MSANVYSTCAATKQQFITVNFRDPLKDSRVGMTLRESDFVTYANMLITGNVDSFKQRIKKDVVFSELPDFEHPHYLAEFQQSITDTYRDYCVSRKMVFFCFLMESELPQHVWEKRPNSHARTKNGTSLYAVWTNATPSWWAGKFYQQNPGCSWFQEVKADSPVKHNPPDWIVEKYLLSEPKPARIELLGEDVCAPTERELRLYSALMVIGNLPEASTIDSAEAMQMLDKAIRLAKETIELEFPKGCDQKI